MRLFQQTENKRRHRVDFWVISKYTYDTSRTKNKTTDSEKLFFGSQMASRNWRKMLIMIRQTMLQRSQFNHQEKIMQMVQTVLPTFYERTGEVLLKDKRVVWYLMWKTRRGGRRQAVLPWPCQWRALCKWLLWNVMELMKNRAVVGGFFIGRWKQESIIFF